jgi:hypothetical protein
MAVSGSVDFNLTASEVIEQAFNVLGKASEGEAMTARMYQDGRVSLNLMLKTWGTAEHLWTKTERSVTLVADTAAYVLTPKPGKVLSVRRRLTVGTDISDIPLTELSRQEYFDLPTRTTSPSTPINWFYDPQSTAGTLYVWPTPSAAAITAGFSLQLTYLRRLDDIDATTDDIDMPQEWLETVAWNLANRLMTKYPVNDPQIRADIKETARELKGLLKAWDTENASIFMQPETWPS